MRKLFMLMAATLAALSGQAAEFMVSGIGYNRNADSTTVSVMSINVTTTSVNVTIPASVTYSGKSYAVKSIAANAFNNQKTVKSVSLPQGLQTIGENAFNLCSGMTTINIPSTVTALGLGAFTNCGALTSISLSDAITTIPENTFLGCYSMTQVKLPANLTTILGGAFKSCRALTSITIPAAVTSINNTAFDNTISLSEINVASGNATYNAQDGILYDKLANGTGRVWLAGRGITSANIKAGTTIIYAFAFEGSKKLTSVTMPNTIIAAGNSILANCPELTSVTLSSNLAILKQEMFSGDSKLQSLIIPQGVTEIQAKALNGCTALRTLSFPASLTTITNDWNNGLNSLETVTVDPANTAFCADGNVMFNKAKTVLVTASRSIEEYTVPSTVKTINAYAFSHGNNLKKLNLNQGLTTINANIIYHCNKLDTLLLPSTITTLANSALNGANIKSLTIPNGVTALQGFTCSYDSALTQVTIGTGVKTFAANAFYGSPRLWKLEMLASVPPANSNAFVMNPTTMTLVVPQGSLAAYKAANYWKNFGEIIEHGATSTNPMSQLPDNYQTFQYWGNQTYTPYGYSSASWRGRGSRTNWVPDSVKWSPFIVSIELRSSLTTQLVGKRIIAVRAHDQLVDGVSPDYTIFVAPRKQSANVPDYANAYFKQNVTRMGNQAMAILTDTVIIPATGSIYAGYRQTFTAHTDATLLPTAQRGGGTQPLCNWSMCTILGSDPSIDSNWYNMGNGNWGTAPVEIYYVDVEPDAPTAIENLQAPSYAIPDAYYDLSGRRVSNPTSGLYIKVQGGKATKVRVER